MDYRELVNLGLTDKEAKVYLAALELGKTTVLKISKKSKVNRATSYVAIESLMQKGLMSSVNEGKKQFFFAESPEKLSLLFREEAMVIQKKQEYLDKIMPNLRALKSDDKEGPVVRYFEGKEGMRAMAEEFFISNFSEQAKMIYSEDLVRGIFSKEELSEMYKRRVGKKIKVKSIVNDSYNKLNTDAEYYKIAKKNYEITCDIAIFDDKVRIATQKGKLNGMIIQNKEISKTLEILFDLAVKYLQKKKGSN